MKNNKRTIIKGIILLMLVAVIGTTYAYFAANITGNESTSTIVVTGGTMEIVYDNLSGTIEAYDIYPRNDAWVTKNFTVTGNNSTNKDMKYKLALKIDKNTFSKDITIIGENDNLEIIPGALTYSLTSVNTSNIGVIVPSQNNQSISYLSEINLGTGSFPKGEDMVHTYTFELFFKDTGENQNKEQGKEFAAHIIIEEAAVEEVVLTQENFEPIIMGAYTEEELNTMIMNGQIIFPEKSLIEDDWVKISEIGEQTFAGVELPVHIIMPSSLKIIDDEAFIGSSITGLTLNEGLESIGELAFNEAANLTGPLTIPSTTKEIGMAAFMQTNITSLTLNEGLESIGVSAFNETANLTGTITIPSTVKTIGSYAFRETGITGLILNEGLESIGRSAFSNATELTGTITIPSTVKTIERYAFNGTGITSLILNEGLESIGDSAFWGATNLTGTLTIPSTVKTIGINAFQSTGITTINYPGTEEDWNQIDIASAAFPEGVTINYNYTGV